MNESATDVVGATELVLALLSAGPRLAAVARDCATRADFAWDGALELLEANGLAALFAERCGSLDLPEAAAQRLAAAVAAHEVEGKAGQLTLLRFLRASRARGVDTILLKGAALIGDVYASPAARRLSDIDVLVRVEQRGLARRAAHDAGFVLGRAQLPAWVYPLFHFHLKLEPAYRTMVPLEIHWDIQSPAHLGTFAIDDLWARRRATSVYGVTTARLDPLDEWLHLATHLCRHADLRGRRLEVEDLRRLIVGPVNAIQLKWIVDLVLTFPRLAADRTPEEIVARVLEWSCEAEAEAMLSLVAELVDEAGARLAAAALRALETRTGVVATHADHVDLGRPELATKSDDALNLRPQVLGRFTGWLAPSSRYLRRRYRIGEGRGRDGLILAATRLGHALAVVARAVAAGLALVLGLLVRPFAAPSRRRDRAAARQQDGLDRYLHDYVRLEHGLEERFGRAGARPAAEGHASARKPRSAN